jgi:hypothetical protein
MQLKWLGVALLAISIILGSITAANVQIYMRKDSYALSADDQTQILDRTVPVPPNNRTEEGDRPWGWIGFNITLPNQGKAGYEARGIILPNNENERPHVLMRIANATPGGGFDLLIFDKFSEQAWNASRIYAIASLPSLVNGKYYDEFRFEKPDNASKYCVFFRGLVNGTEDLEVLLTIKETYMEPGTLIPATLPYAATIGTVGLVGSILIVIGLAQTRRKRFRKRSTDARAR